MSSSYRFVTSDDVYNLYKYILKNSVSKEVFKTFFDKIEKNSNLIDYLETSIGTWSVMINIPNKKINDTDINNFFNKQNNIINNCSAGMLLPLNNLDNEVFKPYQFSDKFTNNEGRYGYVINKYIKDKKYIYSLAIIRPDDTISTFVVNAKQNLGNITCHKSDGSIESFYLSTIRCGSKMQKILNLENEIPLTPRIQSIYPNRKVSACYC